MADTPFHIQVHMSIPTIQWQQTKYDAVLFTESRVALSEELILYRVRYIAQQLRGRKSNAT